MARRWFAWSHANLFAVRQTMSRFFSNFKYPITSDVDVFSTNHSLPFYTPRWSISSTVFVLFGTSACAPVNCFFLNRRLICGYRQGACLRLLEPIIVSSLQHEMNSQLVHSEAAPKSRLASLIFNRISTLPGSSEKSLAYERTAYKFSNFRLLKDKHGRCWRIELG